MTRPAWLETVAGICGGEVGKWKVFDEITWGSPHNDNGGTWFADYDSVAYRGAVRIRVWRADGEVDHARLAKAVQAARAVECGDLDVDALQQQVATLTRERDELAAGPDWRELHALRSFASRVQAAHATPGCPQPLKLAYLPLLAERVEGVANRLAGALETIEQIASAAGCLGVEPADLPARVAALAGPVGPLVPT